jgi:hypothetical protein
MDWKLSRKLMNCRLDLISLDIALRKLKGMELAKKFPKSLLE